MRCLDAFHMICCTYYALKAYIEVVEDWVHTWFLRIPQFGCTGPTQFCTAPKASPPMEAGQTYFSISSSFLCMFKRTEAVLNLEPYSLEGIEGREHSRSAFGLLL